MSSSVVKAVDGLIIPEKIPGDDLWGGDVGAVADGLVASAKALRSGVDDVSTGWAGLPAVFVAPGAEVVWGAVAPASASAHVFAGKVDVIAKALHHYGDGLGSLKRTFAAIKADAVTFRAKIGADGRVWMSPEQTKKYEWDAQAQVGRAQGAQAAVDYLRSRGETARIHYGAVQLRALWTESGDFIDQNNRLLDRVADAYASLNALEAECANKINTQRDDCVADVVAVQGWQLKQSGAQTADLPWGHRVNEDRNCGESFWWGAGNAGLSMVQGLGSLISYNPTTNGWGDWGNAGKAWVGVGTGLGSLLLASFSLTPILAAAGVPLFKDAQTKTQDMLKSLVAWDTWAKNPSEAAGAVLVNVGTFFIPGAGEVGGAIKALTIGTKLEIVASALTKVEAVTSKVTTLIPDTLGDLLTKLKTDHLNIDSVHVDIPTDIHATIGTHPDTPTHHTSSGDHAPDLPSGAHTDTPVALHNHPDPSTSDHGGTSDPPPEPTDPNSGPQHLDPNAPADLDHNGHVPQHLNHPTPVHENPVGPHDGAGPAHGPVAEQIAAGLDPAHSGAVSGNGWVHAPDLPITPKDLHYGETLSGHGDSAYPIKDAMNSKTFDLVSDPTAPYGRFPDGTPLSKLEYDERYVFPDNQDNFPPNDGAVRGTRVSYDNLGALQRDYGLTVDRIGGDRGRFLGLRIDGVSAPFEERSLPISSLGKPLTNYEIGGALPEGWHVEVSEIAPGVGRTGGGMQLRFLDEAGKPVPVTELVDRELLL